MNESILPDASSPCIDVFRPIVGERVAVIVGKYLSLRPEGKRMFGEYVNSLVREGFTTTAVGRTPRSRWAQMPLYDRVVLNLQTEGDCQVYTGARNRWGYGLVTFNGKQRSAHRIVWEHFNGPIPEGYFVCHSCDNPPCCKIEHLWLGTPGDNTRDSVRKGRWGRAGRETRREKQQEQAARAAEGAQRDKTLDSPKSLRAIRRARLMTSQDLAAQAGISPATIWRLESGNSPRPTARVRRAIARALAVAPSDIAEFVD